jgi:hypothetical protein
MTLRAPLDDAGAPHRDETPVATTPIYGVWKSNAYKM